MFGIEIVVFEPAESIPSIKKLLKLHRYLLGVTIGCTEGGLPIAPGGS